MRTRRSEGGLEVSGATKDVSTGAVTLRVPAICFLLAISVVGVYASISSRDLDMRIILGSLACALFITCLLAMVGANRRAFGLMEWRLGSWFLAYGALAHGLATISIVGDRTGSQALVSKELVPAALVIVCVSSACWTAGYAIARRSAFTKFSVRAFGRVVRRFAPEVQTNARVWFLYAIGMIGTGGLIATAGTFGYLGNIDGVSIDTAGWATQPLQILVQMRTVALLCATQRLLRKRPGSAVGLFIPIALIELTLASVSGLKEEFVTVVLAVLIPYVLTTTKLPIFIGSASLIALVAVVFPLVTAVRGEVRGSSGSVSVDEALQSSLGLAANVGTIANESDFNDQAHLLFSRIRLIDNLAVILEKTPESIDYKPVSGLAFSPVMGVIPRAVWREKPVLTSGLDFYRDYYGGTSLSASAVTFQGSLYMFGGLGVLIVGMVLLGGFYRALDEAISRWPDLRGAILILLLFNVLIKQEADVAVLLASLPLTAATYLVALVLGLNASHATSGKTVKVSLTKVAAK